MDWDLKKSRSYYFTDTGDIKDQSVWVREGALVTQALGHPGPDAQLRSWNPSAADAQSNCPALHEVLVALAGAVGPQWKARVRNLYAGRLRTGLDNGISRRSDGRGYIVLDLDYWYALQAAVINWGHFLRDLNPLREQGATGLGADVRDAFLAQFRRLRSEGVQAIADSQLFVVTSREESRASAEVHRVAEMWALGHELAHHILGDGTRKPNREARDRVDEYLSDPDARAELLGLTEKQKYEIRADLLAYLLVAGEFADRAHSAGDYIAASGALLGLLTVGLIDDNWLSERGDDHPSTLTRMAVLAKVASSRILSVPGDGPVDRKTCVRGLASVLTFTAWCSGARICTSPRAGQPIDSFADQATAAMILLEGGISPLFTVAPHEEAAETL